MSKRYYNINFTVECKETFTEFKNKFMDFIESNNYSIGGGIVELNKQGNEIQSSD